MLDLSSRFWTRHREVDAQHTLFWLHLPPYLLLGKDQTDPTVIYIHASFHVSMIFMHQSAILHAYEGRDSLPRQIPEQYRVRLLNSANVRFDPRKCMGREYRSCRCKIADLIKEITRTMRLASNLDLMTVSEELRALRQSGPGDNCNIAEFVFELSNLYGCTSLAPAPPTTSV